MKKEKQFITPYLVYFIYAISGLILLFIFKNRLSNYGVTYSVLTINLIYILFYTYLVYMIYLIGHTYFAWFIALFPMSTVLITLGVVIFNIKDGKETVILDGPEIVVKNNNKIAETLSTYLHSKTAFDAWLRIIAVFL